ncbi:MAG: S41 family peptidase [Amoebophilaceae bacterium]|nr:S41 family peptidase [Amoebophilaceae bacterium]
MIPYQRKWRYPVALLLLLLGILLGSQLQDKYFKLGKNLEIFADVLKELDAHYVDEIDFDALVQVGLDAMLYSLDPYTTFLPEEDAESLKTYTVGEYGGIGAITSKRKGKTIVVMLYQGYPAHKGGLRVGDEISQVNGEDMADHPVEYVSSLLKGMAGTSVQLTVVRQGVQKPLVFTLTREQIVLKNVSYYGQVQEGIGYIRLAGFSTHAADEVQAALESLKAGGMQKLILDLRGNPGGILEEAIKVVNLFIEQGLMVVATKGRVASRAKTYKTTQRAYDATSPIIVLIDQKSASASEIVAGVIQDYDRGVLVGNNTFGKGLVQTTRSLSYNTQLKLTTSKYFIPSGRSIQKIDYSYRQQENTAELVTDMPDKVFTTQAGRRVHDGNGITPDLEGVRFSLAPITVSLIEQGLIFDYVTLFQAQNDHIVAARDFVFSATQYKDFVDWLRDKDYAYTIERSINRLLKRAQNESYTAGIQEQIASLKTQIQRYKEEDLRKFEKEIKLILQEEIIARYYFQEGAISAMLVHDQSIQKACDLFQDMHRYHDLLKVSE